MWLCALAGAASNQDPAPQVFPASAGQDIVRGASQGNTRTLRVKIHQADGTVVQVMAPGFMIADRMLRPALVAVAKGGPKASPASNDNAQTTPNPEGAA